MAMTAGLTFIIVSSTSLMLCRAICEVPMSIRFLKDFTGEKKIFINFKLLPVIP